MNPFCPNLSNKQISSEFQELVSIFGEDKAYFLWDMNNGYSLDKTPNGEASKLFSRFFKASGDRVKSMKNVQRSLMSVRKEYVAPNMEQLSILPESDILSSASDIEKEIKAKFQGYNFTIYEYNGNLILRTMASNAQKFKMNLGQVLKPLGYTISPVLQYAGNKVKIKITKAKQKQQPVAQQQIPTGERDLAYFRYDRALYEQEQREFADLDEEYVQKKREYQSPEMKSKSLTTEGQLLNSGTSATQQTAPAPGPPPP